MPPIPAPTIAILGDTMDCAAPAQKEERPLQAFGRGQHRPGC